MSIMLLYKFDVSIKVIDHWGSEFVVAFAIGSNCFEHETAHVEIEISGSERLQLYDSLVLDSKKNTLSLNIVFQSNDFGYL